MRTTFQRMRGVSNTSLSVNFKAQVKNDLVNGLIPLHDGDAISHHDLVTKYYLPVCCNGRTAGEHRFDIYNYRLGAVYICRTINWTRDKSTMPKSAEDKLVRDVHMLSCLSTNANLRKFLILERMINPMHDKSVAEDFVERHCAIIPTDINVIEVVVQFDDTDNKYRRVL